MTNKEKASELTFKLEDEIGTSLYSRQAIEETFMEMAEWKDMQFEDTKDEIIVDTKKELAWEIHKQISNGVTLTELDRYVCNICDF